MKNRKKTEQSTSTPIILIFWQAVQNDRYATKTGPFVLATLHINAEQAHKDIPKILAQGKYRPHIMLGKKKRWVRV